jgi:hypothetical protein
VKPSARRVLDRLRAADGAWVSGLTLYTPDVGGLRFGGRIEELRKLGHHIEGRPDPSRRTQVWQYRWVAPEPVQQTMGLAS